MNKDLLLSLAEVTTGLRAEEELSGLVITGAGKAFSTGGDPRDYQRAVHDRETDVVAYGNERALEYDLRVGPEVDARSLRLQISGADDMKVDRKSTR